MSAFRLNRKMNMRIDIISLHPGLLEGPFQHSIVKRAIDKDLASVFVHDLRNYGLGKHRQVDDYPFGGGAGMVMRIEPVHQLIQELQSQRDYDEIIYTAPDGELLNQPLANQLSMKGNLIILCGHYKGIDERIRQYLVTQEISIGNYVLSGGELAAAVIADAIIRLIPGVLGDESSALTDSFQAGLVDAPVYTRPANYQGWEVPEVLLSGHQARIDTWRHEEALARTQKRRPDLLSS